MTSSNKVKGLIKGLRYISQIFDNGKEQEIQIGYPTDVKHVAHIGWDGPSVNSPSWMNEYKTSPGLASAPLPLKGDDQNRENDNAVKWVSEDSTSSRRSTRQGQGRDLPELPKASKRPSTGSLTDSPTKEKSDKPRQPRRPSRPKDSSSSDGSRPIRQPMSNDSLQGDEGSPAPPDIPKRSGRRKKSKDSSGYGSSKLRSKAQSPDPSSDLGSPSGSTPKSRNKQRTFEEDNGYQRRAR